MRKIIIFVLTVSLVSILLYQPVPVVRFYNNTEEDVYFMEKVNARMNLMKKRSLN